MNNKRIHICHIIFKLDFGGLENGLVNLINHLPSNVYRHSIICLKGANQFKNRIQHSDVAIFEIHKKEGKDFDAYTRVWKLLRELRADIVHTRNLPAVDMLIPAKLAGTRFLVHSEHGLDISEIHGQHKKYNTLRWLTHPLVNHYICLSHDLVSWLSVDVGIPKKKISLIYNGVNTDIFYPATHSDNAPSAVIPPSFAPEDSFIIGTIGRLEPVKDQVQLAKAFILLLKQRPCLRAKLRLAIVGDGTLRQEIETILADNNASNLAWLPSFRDDTPEIYRSFSVFVLPSRREGISNTILEAMASGLPIIATQVGGNPEIVTEGSTGQLVPAHNPEAIAAALLKYIDNPGLVTTHGKNGHKHVINNFSLESMLKGYLNIYERC